jgi:beta-lysine 5,6-aminomutase alpha subunit
VATEQTIELLGMMTESIHTPLLQDRFAALKGADYVFTAARHLSDEIRWNPDGRIVARARQVLGEARDLLSEVAGEGMFSAIARGAFADVKRPETGGRGLHGVVDKGGEYLNPILDALEGKHD